MRLTYKDLSPQDQSTFDEIASVLLKKLPPGLARLQVELTAKAMQNGYYYAGQSFGWLKLKDVVE